MVVLILLAALIGVPIVEIALLIEVGGMVGMPATVALVIATALLGTALIRHQSAGVWQRMREAAQTGAPPVLPVVDGLLLLVAGIFLLTPGFVTDTIGFLLLVPPLRRHIGSVAIAILAARAGSAPNSRGGADAWRGDVEIEGTYIDLGASEPRHRDDASPWSR